MSTDTADEIELDRPRGPRLRVAFWLVWLLDLVATLAFFVVPYATELNPVTVHLYSVFGLVGVVLAAVAYAGLVVLIGSVLSHPIDSLFLVVAVAAYLLFVTNNYLLLVFGDTLPDLIAL